MSYFTSHQHIVLNFDLWNILNYSIFVVERFEIRVGFKAVGLFPISIVTRN